MSFGGSEQTSQSNSKARSYYDPAQTALVNNYAQGVQQAAQPGGALAYKPYTGPGLSFGDPSSLAGLTNYQAPQATATGYTAQAVDPASVGNVTAGQLASTDLSPYMNPYTGAVIDTTNADLSRDQAIAGTSADAKATAAGAFGGSRSAVLHNLSDDSYIRAKAATDASLRQAGFSSAQGAAGQDIGTKLQADLANQGKGLAVAQGNQTATNAGLQFGATAQNTASLANQAANEQAAQTKLSALGLNAQQAQAIFGANWAEYLNSQTDPQAVQALVNQATSLVPTSPLQTSSSNSFGQGVSLKYGL